MKRFMLLTFIVLISTGIIKSQSMSKIGLGVSTNFSVTNVGFQNSANVSFDFGNIRIGPFIALGNISNTYEPDPNPTHYSTEYITNTLLFGSNFLFLFKKENSLFYIGGGIGYQKSVDSRENKSGSFNSQKYETDMSGLAIIPTIGGEYSISPEFALGVEINYQILSLTGSYTGTQTNSSDEKTKETSDFSTLGAYFTARYFFTL